MPFCRLFYHLIWSTKERLPLIEARFEDELYKVIAAKATQLGATVYAVGGIEDHVHVVMSVPPTLAISELIGQIKGSSSHWVNRNQGVAFKWQAEYGAVTFSVKHLAGLVKYVKNQRQHHQDKTYRDILECCEDE
jgi:putative transposase